MEHEVVGQRHGSHGHLSCGVCRAEARLPEDTSWVDRLNEFLAGHRHAHR